MKVISCLLALSVTFFILSCNKDTELAIVDNKELAILRIETDSKAQINSKTTFTDASISFPNNNTYSNEKIKIRGRGNSTWTFPKKPYKFEFESKIALLGLAPSKEYVLLANYLDGSLMLNSVSMKIGELLKMPFTNHMIPVDLWLNNQYQGSYVLTEQIEVKENRVDIGDDGLLFSMDQVIQATDQSFYSESYRLPIIIKHPNNLNSTQINSIKAEFATLEKAILDSKFPNSGYDQLLDLEAMSNFLLVGLLTSNEEINHPKSTYMYKSKGGKFSMGPIWDFDWGYSYEERQQYYNNPDRPLFWDRKATGEIFFKRIYSDPKVKSLITTKWKKFKAESLPELLKYIDNYANTIAKSRSEDYKKWRRGNENFDIEKDNLKNWFIKRSQFMDKTFP
jgi:hypothetical protein